MFSGPAKSAAWSRRHGLQQVAFFRSLFRSRLPNASHPPPPTYPHAAHPPHHRAHLRQPRRGGVLRRGLTAIGKVVGLAVVAIPVAGVAALVLSGTEDADATELVLSVPRTARVVWWGGQASYRYKALASR